MNGLVKFALGVAGLPPATVADIDKALPGIARLVDAAKQLEPYLEQAHPHIEALTPHLAAAMPHLEALLPIVNKALPIIKTEYPDLAAIIPTAQQIAAFLADKKQPVAAAAPDASRSSIG